MADDQKQLPEWAVEPPKGARELVTQVIADAKKAGYKVPDNIEVVGVPDLFEQRGSGFMAFNNIGPDKRSFLAIDQGWYDARNTNERKSELLGIFAHEICHHAIPGNLNPAALADAKKRKKVESDADTCAGSMGEPYAQGMLQTLEGFRKNREAGIIEVGPGIAISRAQYLKSHPDIGKVDKWYPTIDEREAAVTEGKDHPDQVRARLQGGLPRPPQQ
jgi:hypothetical protein